MIKTVRFMRSAFVLAGALAIATLASAQSAPKRREPHATPLTKHTKQSNGDAAFSLWKDGELQDLMQSQIKPRGRITEADLIHVVVNERSVASITANTDLKRRFEAEAKLRDWIHLAGLQQLTPADQELSIDFTSDRRTRGLGRRDRRDQISFRIQVKIEEDLGGGILFISGTKQIELHDEKSTLKLQGYVHRRDISERRIVQSEFIDQLQLLYTGSGSMTANYTRSIWGWILDLLWF